MADDNVFHFPPRRDGAVPPPPLPPAPPALSTPRPSTPVGDAPTGRPEAGPADATPRMPQAPPMSVPVALMMPPPPPLPGASDSDDSDDEGAFAPPSPEDPVNPTGRETLQVCMAILTAMGVAAASGMWHRARQRQARADLVRAQADKTADRTSAHGHGGHGGGRSGGSGHGGGRGGSRGSGPLTGSRQEGTHRKRHASGHAGGHGGDRKGSKGAHGGHGPGAGGRSSHGPHGTLKSTGGGKASKRRKGGGKDGLGTAGPCVQNRKPRKPDATAAPKAAKGGKRRAPGADTPAPKKRPAPLKWKAAKKTTTPGPGDDRALPPGQKRWTRTTPKRRKSGDDDGLYTAGPCVQNRKPRKPVDQPGATADTMADTTAPKAAEGGKRRAWRTRLLWKSTPAWLKRRRTRHTAAGSTTAAGEHHGRESSTGSTPPPPPFSGTQWMRPPPGADRSTRVSVERVNEHAHRGEPATARPALPPAAASSTTAAASRPAGWAPASDESVAATPSVTLAASSPTVPIPTDGAHMSPLVPAPRATGATRAADVTGTQYRDADLTIYDVIDADADAAEEITEGVDEALATAAGCERLMTKLEAVYAEIVDLKVPGLLAGMLLKLIDKTLTVKARAEAIAENLPAAAEAIATAGDNAADRHRHLADVTRDMGHVRPADREYHLD